MKRSKNWQTLTIVGLALCTLAVVPAQGQDLDLSVDDVVVEIVGNGYQAAPHIGLANHGNLANHLLQVAIYYGPIMVELLEDGVQYVQNHHTCWNYLYPNCGQGECLDIVSFTAYYAGNCQRSALFYFCGCKYTITPYVQWIPYAGQATLTVVVDPYNLVPEVDETNNTMTIDLEPVADETITWTAVKSIYR
ncbi:hypothetical protein KKG45_02020 [bacterium]|nr:hypothetical protein [bacterium]MBU1072004.1 hypothetical protein [bacterium]MBU1675312.1 hypothetical protein [bacterium]